MKTTLSKLPSRLLAAAVLSLTVAFSSGCFLVAVGAAGAAGAGAVAYVKGELDATLDHRYEAVVDSASNSVGQLHFALISQTQDGASTVVTARTGEDTKVVITVERVEANENLAKVKIRVGTFGNETLSRAILDQIKRNL